MCREVCTEIVSVRRRGQIVGTPQDPIQIDESKFGGKRKYNRGRLLLGDRPPRHIDDAVNVDNNRNHGNRVDGPWVFGIKNSQECRFFHVQRRNRATLEPIILRECALGSTIHSDEWSAYSNLNQIGYNHSTVNHQHFFIDPNTNANTQSLERTWLDAKAKIERRMRGVPLANLQSHLDHFCWKMLRKNAPDMFLAFLQDIVTVYR